MPIELSIELVNEVELDMTTEDDTVFELEPIKNVNSIQHNNYELLQNKPSINSVELTGEKTFEQLGMKPLSNTEIHELLGGKL